MLAPYPPGQIVARRDLVTFLLCAVVTITASVAAPNPATTEDTSKVSSKVTTGYFANLRHLSEPERHAEPWDYFGTNELSFHENYPAVAGSRGAIVGVGFQQNFSLALWADPPLYVILDIEPTVAALVPFFGLLMEACPARRAWLSRIIGVDLTPEEFRRLVEPARDDAHAGESLEAYLKRQIATTIGRVPRSQRDRSITALNHLLENEILVHMPIEVSQHERILSNLESLTDAEKSLAEYGPRVLPAEKERGLLEFLYNHASVSFNASDVEIRRAQATWFSSEENYRRTRTMWLDGRFVGVIADIRGPRVAALGRWLREQDVRVSAVYVSNVPEYYHGKERQAIFDNLRHLPLEDDAQLLTTYRSRFDLLPLVRSFRTIDWWYRSRPWIVSIASLAVAIAMLAVIWVCARRAKKRSAELLSVLDGRD